MRLALMKLAVMLCAIARASSVLPVPGGPYSSTPLGDLIPTLEADRFQLGNMSDEPFKILCRAVFGDLQPSRERATCKPML